MDQEELKSQLLVKVLEQARKLLRENVDLKKQIDEKENEINYQKFRYVCLNNAYDELVEENNKLKRKNHRLKKQLIEGDM